MIEEISFRNRHPNIVCSRYDMRRSADFVHLENGGFILIALRHSPGKASEKIGVVKGGVVVAPVGNILDRACRL